MGERIIYQIYPQSFQDSDGDGVGDLRGITERLDHVQRLGADTVWLSPIYPSPRADSGYDITDHAAVDPLYGTLADFDELVRACHERGLELILDLVLCHTSIEHRWFRDHPDWYVWAESGPPNNWISAFGGSSWSRDPATGGWYLHSFFPEQPDLNWRNPQVEAAMHEMMRFWLQRNVDGFRLDALTALVKDAALRDDPPARSAFGLPLHPDRAALALRYSRNSPDLLPVLSRLREVAGEALLLGEVGLPTAQLVRYLDHLDLAFAFETFHAPWDAALLRRTIEAAVAVGGRGRLAWVLSNHDYSRLATRVGWKNERTAAMLLLTLPGTAVVYQGDEIGLGDGLPECSCDRAGRDAYRSPMQWETSPHGGFTTGTPWLPLVDPEIRNVAGQERDSDSLLHLFRDLIRLRRTLGPEFAFLETEPDVLAFRRGDFLVALNMGDHPRPAPSAGVIILATEPPATSGILEPHTGLVTLSPEG
jgi:alpha-glucosidase